MTAFLPLTVNDMLPEMTLYESIVDRGLRFEWGFFTPCRHLRPSSGREEDNGKRHNRIE